MRHPFRIQQNGQRGVDVVPETGAAGADQAERGRARERLLPLQQVQGGRGRRERGPRRPHRHQRGKRRIQSRDLRRAHRHGLGRRIRPTSVQQDRHRRRGC